MQASLSLKASELAPLLKLQVQQSHNLTTIGSLFYFSFMSMELKGLHTSNLALYMCCIQKSASA